MALLEVEDVAAGYGAGPDILRGLSLRIEQDRSYCIIGPNGAGKSTLLRVICGLLPARRGRVSFKGKPLAGLRADEILRRGICFVPQDKSLFPDMTVRENVRMGGYILKDRREVERRVEAVFALFPILRERAARPAKVLSGGEQQMLLLGRALVLQPQIIMLDEPSLGLVPKVARQIFDSIGPAVARRHDHHPGRAERQDWPRVRRLGLRSRSGQGGVRGCVRIDPRGAAHPGAVPRAAPRLPAGSGRMTHAIQILLLGLALGGVYALMASGLTLIFGVMGIVNLAHAAFMTVAAYLSFLAFARYGLDPMVSIVLVMPLMFPDLNPIEQAFAKLKALLRRAAARSVDVLWQTIGQLLDAFSPADAP